MKKMTKEVTVLTQNVVEQLEEKKDELNRKLSTSGANIKKLFSISPKRSKSLTKAKSAESNVVQQLDVDVITVNVVQQLDVDKEDSCDFSPDVIMSTLCYGSVDDLDTLISNGLSIEQLETGSGRNALPAVAACGNREAMVKRLIELGVDMFATNEEGQTALELAKLNNADGVVAILEQNMNFAIGCKDGQYEMVANILQSTPLHLCEKVSICDAKTLIGLSCCMFGFTIGFRSAMMEYAMHY